MGTRLKVNTEALRKAADGLDLAKTELGEAKVQAGKAAEAVGDEKLAEAIRDFASTWETRRGQIVKAVDGLANSLRGVADNFEMTDNELSKALGKTS